MCFKEILLFSKVHQHLLTYPISNLMPRRFFKVLLICGTTIFPCKEHLLFSLLGGRLDQAAIGTLIAVHMVCTAHKRSGLHHFAADFFKCSCAEVRHVDGFGQHHLFPQLFKAGQEHPTMLSDHCLKTIVGGHSTATLNKDGKQVGFAVGVVLFDKVVDVGAQVAGSGIGRIRAGNPILPCHGFANINEPVQLLGCIFHAHAVHADLTVGILRCHKPAQQLPVVALHIQDRAILLGIGQGVQQTFQLHLSGVLLDIVHPCAEIFQVRTVNAVALLNGIDMTGVFTV